MAENRFAQDSALAPEAATHEPASPVNPGPPHGAAPLLADCLAETFPPGARKPRHDGFTPEAVAGFLEDLAAHGIVEHAARAAGVSAQAAYAFRNRRAGRAFALMWDAVLIHRARARLAAENQHVATLGCVSRRYRDGVLVGEYHYRDNRLAMAMLSRLDRLAESAAPDDDHLRALSEDLDEFIACAAEGGDLDAFVEARRPEWLVDEDEDSLPDPEQARPDACELEDGPDDEVWLEPSEDIWLTNVPPPPGFTGWQMEQPGKRHFQRELTAEEEAAWEARDEADADYALPDRSALGDTWYLVHGSFFPEHAAPGGAGADAQGEVP